MKKISELHNEAMKLADQADLAKKKGEFDEAIELYQHAFQLEEKASELVRNDILNEPTRSVLHRSAASLAIDCLELREAERLIAFGLSGEPPEEIANELRELNDKVNFERHLELKGITLAPFDVQMSISGSAIGLGVAHNKELLGRIDAFQKIIYRTAERIEEKPYREGALSKEMKDMFSIYVSVPRAASFAVTLRLGKPAYQSRFDMHSTPESVLDDALRAIELLNESKEDQLVQLIPDKVYFRNFVGLSKRLAPTGKDISQVGLTTFRANKQKKLSLRRLQKEFPSIPFHEESSINGKKRIEVKGHLVLADKRSGSVIGLRVEKDVYKLIVPEGMMADIVKPLWDEDVIVKGYEIGKRKIKLSDIQKCDD